MTYQSTVLLKNCTIFTKHGIYLYSILYALHIQSSDLISPGPVAQSVVSPIADPGVMSLIQAWPHTFIEIDFEIFSMVIFLLPLI